MDSEKVEVEVKAKRTVIKVNELVIESGEDAYSTTIKINGKVANGVNAFTYHIDADKSQLPKITMTVYPDHFKEVLLCHAKEDEDAAALERGKQMIAEANALVKDQPERANE